MTAVRTPFCDRPPMGDPTTCVCGAGQNDRCLRLWDQPDPLPVNAATVLREVFPRGAWERDRMTVDAYIVEQCWFEKPWGERPAGYWRTTVGFLARGWTDGEIVTVHHVLDDWETGDPVADAKSARDWLIGRADAIRRACGVLP